MSLDELLVLDHEPRRRDDAVIRPFREYPQNWPVTVHSYDDSSELFVDGDSVNEAFKDHYEAVFKRHADVMKRRGAGVLRTMFKDRYGVSFNDAWAHRTYQAVQNVVGCDDIKEMQHGFRYASEKVFSQEFSQLVQRSLEAGATSTALAMKLRRLGFKKDEVNGKGCDAWISPDGRGSIAIPCTPANTNPGDYVSRFKLAYENAERRSRGEPCIDT